MQNRHLTGEERSAKTREEVRDANGGIPLLTDLCLAMRSDSLNVRFPGPTCDSVSTLSSARESSQRSGWDDTELVQTGGLQSTDE